MPDAEKEFPESEKGREVIEAGKEKAEGTPEKGLKDSKEVISKLKEKTKSLFKRGKDRLQLIKKRLKFSEEEAAGVQEDFSSLKEEADKVLDSAEEELLEVTDDTIISEKSLEDDGEYERVTDDMIESETSIEDEKNTKDEDPGTKAPNPKAKSSEQEKAIEQNNTDAEAKIMDPDEIGVKYEGQASPWESMPEYIKKIQNSNRSETRKGVEIYERMRQNLIDRAEGNRLIGSAEQINGLNTELESYQEALDELNKEIDLQREKNEEIDEDDIEQTKKLEEEIMNLEEKIDIQKGKESKDIDVEKEKEEIRQALILMHLKGDNVNSSLGKLKEELLEERKDVEEKLDLEILQDKENLQEDIDYYDQVLNKDEVVISLDDPSLIKKISKLNTREGGKIDIIDSNGEVLEGKSQISVVDFMARKDGYTEMKDKNLRLNLTDKQRETLEERKVKKENQLEIELSNKADIKRKKDNLTEMIEIVGEVQTDTEKLSKAWKEAFKEVAKDFDLKSEETATLRKMYKDKKDEFIKEQLQKLSVDEINKADGKENALEFIQGNIEVDKAA